MSGNILFFNDEECRDKINIDELYDRNHRREDKMLSIFKKILNRLHKRIEITAKQKPNEKYIWFTVPSYIFGEPTYEHGQCIAHIIQNLADNGFYVKYLAPNTVFVSWENWIPSYIRRQVKKKTGKSINEKGEIIHDSEEPEDLNMQMLNTGPKKPEKTDKPDPMDNKKLLDQSKSTHN